MLKSNKFKCKRCGWCCRNVNINISYSDILRWSKERRLDILNKISYIDHEDSEKRGFYITETVTAPKKPCPLLEGNGDLPNCSIYKTRPKACKDFPQTHKKDVKCPARKDFQLDEQSLFKLKREQSLDFRLAEDRRERLLQILEKARQVVSLLNEIREFGEDPTESLWVDGLGTEKTAWSEVGDSPFLSAQDQPANYIYSEAKKAEHGDFTFTDHTLGSGTINSVTLYIYGQATATGTDVWIWDGSTWQDYVNPAIPLSWNWFTIDISAFLNSWAKIDAAKMYFKHRNSIARDDIDAAYLLIDYTPTGTPVSDSTPCFVAGGLQVSDSNPCYVAGGVNVSDSNPAYLKGKDTSSSSKSCYLEGVEWLPYYSYRKRIPITGQSGAGTNYQVPLEVHSGSGSDGNGIVYLSGYCTDFPNDLRFTDNDGITELDHWLESESGGVAQFWIEIADDLGSNRNFYIYYCKSGVASGSDGQFTFPAFEPFDNYRLAFVAEESWNINTLFSKTGTSLVRYMKDINDDSEKELICNVGAQSHFAAIKPDDTIIWQNEVRTVKHVAAYYPKIHGMTLYYGDRDNDTIYAIDLSSGNILWSKVRSGLVALNICDKGVVYGATNKVGILDFDNGNEISGWPFAFTPHEQILIAGDLDDDGKDEIVCCDNSGVIKAIDHDGSLMFTITSDHTHVDMMFIGDVDSTHQGKELVAVVDDNNSVAGEGDEIATYDDEGTQLNKYTCSTGGVLIRVGNVRPDKAGLEIAFCQEDQGIVGLLDGELNEIWKKTGLTGETNRTSQLQLADINGDGKLEVLTNSGESSSYGFYVLNNKGELLGTVINNIGWDFDPRLDIKTGEPFSADDVDADGKAELMPSILKGDDFTSNNIIYLDGESASPINLDGQGLWTRPSGAPWAIQIDVKKHGTRAVRSGTGSQEVLTDKNIVLAGDLGCGFWIRSADVTASSVPLIYLGNNVGSQSALVVILGSFIKAYNGDGVGGGAWVNLVAVANDTWYWVEILLDHTSKEYDVKVNGTLYDNGGSHFGFRHAPSSQGWMRVLRTENELVNAYVDSIYFRKYVDPEPSVGTAELEQKSKKVYSSKNCYVRGGQTSFSSKPCFISGQSAGTPVSDSQSCYVGGKQLTSDSNPCYVAGGVNVSDSNPAYLKGKDTSSSSKSAYLKGKDTGSSFKSCYIKGKDTSSSSKACYVNGGINVTTSKSAYLKGKDTALSNKSAYVSGGINVSSSKPSYLKGRDTSNSSKPCYIAGGINVLDSQSCFVAGVEGASDSQSAYIKGKDTASDSQLAFIKGKDVAFDNKSCYIAGGINVTDSTASYIKGKDTAIDNKAAYVSGGINVLDSQSAYIKGQSTALSSKPCYMVGGINTDSSKSCYVKGQDSLVDSQSCYIRGKLSTLDSQSCYIKGQGIAADSKFCYIKGEEEISSSKSCFVAGGIQTSDSQSCFIKGGVVSSDSKSCYISGIITEASDSKPCYIKGVINVLDSQPAYIRGQATTSDSQSCYIAGGIQVSDSQNCFVSGIIYETPCITRVRTHPEPVNVISAKTRKGDIVDTREIKPNIINITECDVQI